LPLIETTILLQKARFSFAQFYKKALLIVNTKFPAAISVGKAKKSIHPASPAGWIPVKLYAMAGGVTLPLLPCPF
jgi:hypothetical protein